MQVWVMACGQVAAMASGKPLRPSQTTMHTSLTPRFFSSVSTCSRPRAHPRRSHPHRRTHRPTTATTPPGHVRRDHCVTRLLLTVPEAAKALAISRSKLYELIASGALRSVRIDGSRRVPLDSLTSYVNHLMEEAA